MMTYGISHLTSQNKYYSSTFTSSPFFLEKKISLLVLYHLYVDVQYSPEAKLKTVYIYIYILSQSQCQVSEDGGSRRA